MQAQALWELFRDTGAPEAYLLYRQARCEGKQAEGKEEGPQCI